MIAAVQQQQQQSDNNNALSPKPQQQKPISRAPSPVPSAVYSNNQVLNNSSPKLPLPRRSSFSTDNVSSTKQEFIEEKPLITQRSYPHLPTSKKHKKKQQYNNSRRGSDTTNFSTDGALSDGVYSLNNASTTTFANDKRNHDFHVLFRSVPDNERLIDGKVVETLL
jgi:hypothetical protein